MIQGRAQRENQDQIASGVRLWLPLVLMVFFVSACATKSLQLSGHADVVTTQAPAGSKPVYGDDNRVELAHAGRALCHAARSVPGLLPKQWLTSADNNAWTLQSLPSLSDNGWCSDQRFATQPAGIHCSGILIAPNRIATAGHCINASDDPYGPALNCADVAFIFDYRFDINGHLPIEYSHQQVYFCQRIVAGKSGVQQGDWRIVELDRDTGRRPPPVLDRVPANLAALQMEVIGHPLGLPLKATTQGSFQSMNPTGSFQVSIDTFEGNSGSPVLSIQSGSPVVIGMLVRGETDSVSSRGGNCRIVKQCSESSCAGERVTPSTDFASWSSNPSSTLDHLPDNKDRLSLCY